ncbi:hypothetical protein AB0D08_00970 [Kitasatospora sp. NPDC048540]|uniref:hypothetical protein n=1 Tax=unclassified Kitasatospora TaxID=2633591 RepID=UPI00053AC6D0|nr:hypothetical protein [Kitasatospora sp. MBT63]
MARWWGSSGRWLIAGQLLLITVAELVLTVGLVWLTAFTVDHTGERSVPTMICYVLVALAAMAALLLGVIVLDEDRPLNFLAALLAGAGWLLLGWSWLTGAEQQAMHDRGVPENAVVLRCWTDPPDLRTSDDRMSVRLPDGSTLTLGTGGRCETPGTQVVITRDPTGTYGPVSGPPPGPPDHTRRTVGLVMLCVGALGLASFFRYVLD